MIEALSLWVNNSIKHSIPIFHHYNVHINVKC